MSSGRAEMTGSSAAVEELLSLFDTFEFWFNIVTP
ncbi:MAG: alkyl sulfatase C-terminal domain-containing protein [Candidatus Nanopelagicales bacterium]